MLEVSLPQSGRRLASGAEGVSLATATGVHNMNHSTSERRMLTRHCSACASAQHVKHCIGWAVKETDTGLTCKENV